mgnify:CR=1 FL=1
MKKQYGDKASELFDISDYLTSKSLTVSDIDSVVFMVKSCKTDEDADALFNKTLVDSIQVIEDLVIGLVTYPAVVSVPFEDADYGEGLLEIGPRYVIGLGYKTLTDTKNVEIDLEDHVLQITQDIMRD